MAEAEGLVSVLHGTSGVPCGVPAFASTYDTSRTHDKCPVYTQACRIQNVVSTKNVLPEHGILAQNPSVQLEKNREANCLSSREREVPKPHEEYSTLP
jgi:hypothetical protein